jgi:hypothetical protein
MNAEIKKEQAFQKIVITGAVPTKLGYPGSSANVQ